MIDIVERAKAALEGVTEGPWDANEAFGASFVCAGDRTASISRSSVVRMDNRPGRRQDHIDAEFIAAARDLVPELVAEVERLRSYRSIPQGMVWQDYYSPDEVIKVRKPLDDEIERLRTENKRLRSVVMDAAISQHREALKGMPDD